jgi:hypothetical protein
MRRRRTLTRRSLTWRGRRVTTPSRRRRRSSLSATLLRSLLPLPYLVASRVPWWVLLNSSLLTFSFPGSLSVWSSPWIFIPASEFFINSLIIHLQVFAIASHSPKISSCLYFLLISLYFLLRRALWTSPSVRVVKSSMLVWRVPSALQALLRPRPSPMLLAWGVSPALPGSASFFLEG